nr:unnamed protein product [Digitaria exilis]
MAATDPPIQQNAALASALSAKMHEDRMKVTVQTQRDVSDEASMKQRLTESIGPLLESNPTSVLKSPARPALASGQIFHRSAGGMSGSLPQPQTRSEPLRGSVQLISGYEGRNKCSFESESSRYKWVTIWSTRPLFGLEQLRSGFLQQKAYMHSPQPLQHQLQFLTQQQQVLLQAQQNMTASSVEMDNRRFQMLFSTRNFVPGRDGRSNAFTEIIPTVGQSLQNMCLPMQGTDTDILMKKIAALQQQKQQQSSSQQQLLQHPLLNQQQQNSNYHASEQEKMGAGAVTVAFHGHEPVDMDHFVEDGSMSMEDNVEPFLSHDDTDPRAVGSHCITSSKGYILQEMSSAQASTSSVLCCHFSSDGKLLATGGHDKKACGVVLLWNGETLTQKSTFEEHSLLITDVRFSPNTPRLATSSFDKTVRVWDLDNQGYSIRTFTGHSASVMSLDFHSNKDDLICSCDGDNEIRFWSIKHGNIVRIFKGGSTQLRFQPRYGGYLATASDNIVSILDVETQSCVRRFESLELWDMAENRSMTIAAHDSLISAVASSSSGLVASTSHDKYVKLWR